MEKDITEKILLDYNDIFADVVNALLFDGEERVKPDELVSAQSVSMYKTDGEVHEQERDVVKFWTKGGVCFSMFGIENQSAIDPMMPLRVIGYDGANYRSQLSKGSMAERTKGYPVITLVLHYGDKEWVSRKALKECIAVPKELEEYVNDYKINVFNISFLSDEERSRFRSDFRAVADFFHDLRVHGRDEHYVPKDLTVKAHVDEVLKLLSIFSRIEASQFVEMEGGINVESAFAETFKYWEERGLAAGRAEGRAEERINLLKTLLSNGFVLNDLLHYGFSKEEISRAEKTMMEEAQS